MKSRSTALVAAFLLAAAPLWSQTTQRAYLSGKGNDSTVGWKFFCTKGRQSGRWTEIAVPSNWECQGFGQYTYGHMKQEDRLDESGIYRHSFRALKEWQGKRVFIVFEGAMTDTHVSINGKSAGEMHQGGYYEFRYDISGLLRYGRDNTLEVRVDKSSSNESVVNAERFADFWVMGGIFRPVYLEVKPAVAIDGFGIDAKADGSIRVSVSTLGKAEGCTVSACVETLDGKALGKPFSAAVDKDGTALLRSEFTNPALWSAEYPNLHVLKLSLVRDGRLLHTVIERFGFRTVELRPSDGVYVNGARIKFRGVDRHSFWPETGRTLSDGINLQDALLIKEMNMNAVRMSHYPPEKRFLELCDSLGLYVIDELTGWQAAYDTEVGKKLVREMVIRDRNHPSILFWANGNEGGFNFDLIGEYPRWDLQGRRVIHPWLEDEDVNNFHYPTWDSVNDYLSKGRKVWFPTEFDHGLYDGGHGAGLEDYWTIMQSDPLCAGGFLWDLIDQAIVRTDEDGRYDTDGNHGADGILGPHREKEGSFYAIKDIWSPVQLEGPGFVAPTFDGTFTVGNRYSFTNLKDCRFKAELERIGFPEGKLSVKAIEVSSPDVGPGQEGLLHVELPPDFNSYDVLRLTAFGPDGKELYTWSRNITTARDHAARLLDSDGTKTEAVLDGGRLVALRSANASLPLSNARLTYEGAKPGQIEFENLENGWVKVDYTFAKRGYFDNIGVTFDFPEDEVKGLRWLGNGPYRVWKNRLRGVTFGLWEKSFNDTATGESWEYPEFKGYHSNMYVADLSTGYGTLHIVFASDDLFLRVLTPRKPEQRNNDNTLGVFPEGQISILNGISPVGTKFSKAESTGPQGAKNYSEYVPKRGTTHSTGTFYLKFTPAEYFL